MSTGIQIFTGVAAVFLAAAQAHAGCCMPVSLEEQAARADGAFRGTALWNVTDRAEDGRYYTTTGFRVDETLKGQFASTVSLRHPGGRIRGRGEIHSLSPKYVPGEEYLVFVQRKEDGGVQALDGCQGAIPLIATASDDLLMRARMTRSAGGLDLSDQQALSAASEGEAEPNSALPGLLPNNARFVLPDRDESIGYILDTQVLPSGMTQAEVATAVQNAMAAWTAITSVRFVFEGYQNFGGSPLDYRFKDGKLRIQCHDFHNALGTNSLGATVGVTYGSGGRLSSTEFERLAAANIVISHNKPGMNVPKNFEETICHEIGHALGLAHSSENPNETDTTLRQATMYYLAHHDLRGATLGTYDRPIIMPVYPTGNRPPYAPDRYIRAITTTSPATTPGVNEVTLTPFDLHTPAGQLVLTEVEKTSQLGTFTRNGLTIKYTPGVFPGPTQSYEPGDDLYYNFDSFTLRLSDGVFDSGLIIVEVVSYRQDTRPVGAGDGIPDFWMTQHFGSIDPAAGAKRGANADFDNDSLTNLQEFRAGTSPTDRLSRFGMTFFDPALVRWTAKPWEAYEVKTSSDLINWTRVTWPVVPISTTPAPITATHSLPANASTRKFYRVEQVR